jgi:hypothetical protein
VLQSYPAQDPGRVQLLLILLHFDRLVFEEVVCFVHGQLDVSWHVANKLVDGQEEDEKEMLQSNPAQDPGRVQLLTLLLLSTQLQGQQAAVGYYRDQTCIQVEL